MVIKKIRNLALLLIVLIFNLFIDIAKIQASEYFWWNGKEKINLDLIPNQLVEFFPAVDNLSNPASSRQISKRSNVSNVRILKITSADYSKIIKAKSTQENRVSPLFKQGSDIKALAGGVLITFKVNTLDSDISNFCQSQGYQLKKKYSFEGQAPVWLIESPVGLESLRLSNAITEMNSPLIEKVRPNFWQSVGTRELKNINFPKKRKLITGQPN